HIVILEQVFARFEVLRLHRLLGGLDAARDQLRLDRDTFFHSEPLEQIRDPLLGEDAHQVIFEREVETRRTGVSLAARASAKLVVNAAGFVTLSPKNEETASRSYFIVLFVGLSFVAIQGL